MTNYIKNILRAGLFALLVSCLQFDSTLEKVFDRQELQTVNKIIIFYDTFVLQQVESASTIDKAYRSCQKLTM
jgi:hypothetical protein